MNKDKLQWLGQQREDIRQLLSLFDREAFLPYEKGNGGDPTAIINAIWDTRIALGERGESFLENKEAALIFSELKDRLRELEKKLHDKFPKVDAVAYDWRGKPINTHERMTSVKEILGNDYNEAADFLRTEAVGVHNLTEKAVEVLNKLDAEVKAFIDADYLDYPVMEIVLEKYNITSTNSVINTNSTLIGVNQTINLASNLDAVTKQQLKEQIDTLQAQLHEIGQTKKEDVEAIVKAAKVLVDEASSAQPNKKHVKNLAEGLKSAAEGIASVMPTVMKIVKIVFQVVGITLV